MASTSTGKTGKRQLVNQVPSCFEDLAKAVAVFYDPIELVIIRLLIHYECLEEGDLEYKMEIDTALLQARISILRYDRIIRERTRFVREDYGKIRKIQYYFLNYRSLPDVVKYKLVKIGQSIQESTSKIMKKDLFRCTQCPQTFDELKAGQLFDPVYNDYYCTHCRALVEENTEREIEKDNISIADFNKRTSHLEQLLKECDKFELNSKLFEPRPKREVETTVNITDD